MKKVEVSCPITATIKENELLKYLIEQIKANRLRSNPFVIPLV